jgi:hypothetical protein
MLNTAEQRTLTLKYFEFVLLSSYFSTPSLFAAMGGEFLLAVLAWLTL